MATRRDQVRYEAGERLDKPDVEAAQLNARSDIRAHVQTLVTGTATGPNAQPILGGWSCSIFGGANQYLNVNAGTAFLSEILADGTNEYGVAAGVTTTTAAQVLDFTGRPDGAYTVYIRFSHAAGELGTRVFWNAGTAQEDLQAINTRQVARWTPRAELGGVPPAADYVAIATVTSTAGALSALVMIRNLMFEGQEAAGPVYTAGWGDGVNDRNVDRGTYGLTHLFGWAQAVIRQIKDIIGAANGWYDAIPGGGLTGILASLNAHTGDSSDPHGASMTLTGDLDIGGGLDVVGTMAKDIDGTSAYVIGSWARAVADGAVIAAPGEQSSISVGCPPDNGSGWQILTFAEVNATVFAAGTLTIRVRANTIGGAELARFVDSVAAPKAYALSVRTVVTNGAGGFRSSLMVTTSTGIAEHGYLTHADSSVIDVAVPGSLYLTLEFSGAAQSAVGRMLCVDVGTFL